MDVAVNWELYTNSPAAIATAETPALLRPPDEITTKGQLHFPFDGEMSHWQSGETVRDFVRRLQPSTANELEVGPWIWIRNPFLPPRVDRQQDEEALTVSGQQLLQDYLDLKDETAAKMPGSVKASITRKLGPRRSELEQDLKQTAINAQYLTGKWLLFPSLAEVDRIWSTVAQSVCKGQLGPMAKVATGSIKSPDGARVICIYTKDFTDQKDVKRVLDALVELDLVDLHSTQSISYKSDAYTVLGIDYNNEYGIKASQYRSRELLGGATRQQPAPAKKQRTGFTF